MYFKHWFQAKKLFLYKIRDSVNRNAKNYLKCAYPSLGSILSNQNFTILYFDYICFWLSKNQFDIYRISICLWHFWIIDFFKFLQNVVNFGRLMFDNAYFWSKIRRRGVKVRNDHFCRKIQNGRLRQEILLIGRGDNSVCHTILPMRAILPNS